MSNHTHELVEQARRLAGLTRDLLQSSLETSSQTEGILILRCVRDAGALGFKLDEIESAIRHDSEPKKSTPEKA